ncbi:MAG: hypothetical protein ACRDZY_07160 [Acidimicrobiales bacterium]
MSHSYSVAVRPTPLRDAAKSIGTVAGIVGGLVSGAVTYGLLSGTQGGAITALLAAIPGVIGLVSALLSAFGVVMKAEPLVTPVDAPQDNQGNRLTASLIP